MGLLLAELNVFFLHGQKESKGRKMCHRVSRFSFVTYSDSVCEYLKKARLFVSCLFQSAAKVSAHSYHSPIDHLGTTNIYEKNTNFICKIKSDLNE